MMNRFRRKENGVKQGGVQTKTEEEGEDTEVGKRTKRSNNNLEAEDASVSINHDDNIDRLLRLSGMILHSVHQANAHYLRLTAQSVFPIMSARNQPV